MINRMKVVKVFVTLLAFCCLFQRQASAGDMTFAVATDSRGTKDSGGLNAPVLDKVFGQISKENVAFTFFPGDTILGDADLAAYRKQLTAFGDVLKKHLDPKKFFTTMGNHEVIFREHIEAFRQAFGNPENGPKKYSELTYFVEKENNLFVVLATDFYGESGLISDEQLGWLRSVLESHKNADHVFVFGHQAAYPAGVHVLWSLDQYPEARDRFWKLLREYNVDAYFCGHEHFYFMKKVDDVYQVTVGSAGAPLYSGYDGEFYHYGIVKITGGQVSVVVKDEEGKIRREFSFERNKKFRSHTAAEVTKWSDQQIVKGLQSDDDNTILWSAWMADRKKLKAAVPLMIEKLTAYTKENSHTKLRAILARGLGRMKVKTAVPLLKELKVGKNLGVANEASVALERIDGKF